MNVLPQILNYGNSESECENVIITETEVTVTPIVEHTESFLSRLYSCNGCSSTPTPRSVVCGAEPCPVILNSDCVFYEGPNLVYTGINTNDTLQDALEKIEIAVQSAAGVINGTPNIIAKFTTPNTIGNSSIVDDGSSVNFGLPINGIKLVLSTNDDVAGKFTNNSGTYSPIEATNLGAGDLLVLSNNSAAKFKVSNIGEILFGSGNVGTLSYGILTGARTWTLPDASGTLALTSSLAGYLPLTGGTLTGPLNGTSILLSSSLTANSIIKTGGTSSQFLKADGSVDSNTYLTTSSAASTYVPYVGATANVNLGSNSITTNGIFSTTGQFTSALVGTTASMTTADSVAGLFINNSPINNAPLQAVNIGGGSLLELSNNLGSPFRVTNAGNILFGIGNVSTLSFGAPTAFRTWTLPDASGTIALTSDLSGYLPLTGGTLTGQLNGTTITANYFWAINTTNPAAMFQNASVTNNTVNIFNGSSDKLLSLQRGDIPSAAGLLTTDVLSVFRTWTLPDASGTIALTSNLGSYVPYTGATTGVDLGSQTFTTLGAATTGTLTLKNNVSAAAIVFSNSTSQQRFSIDDTSNFNLRLNATPFALDGTYTRFSIIDALGIRFSINGDGFITSASGISATTGAFSGAVSALGYTGGYFSANGTTNDGVSSIVTVARAGYFQNNSVTNFTLWVENLGASGLAVFRNSGGSVLTVNNNGSLVSASSITGTSIIRTGGTSTQFLKADGSVDNNTYATTASLAGYLPLTGGTLTGGLNGTSAAFSSTVTGSGIVVTNGATGIRVHSSSGSTSNNDAFVGADASLIYFTNYANNKGFTVNNSSGLITALGALSGTSASFSGVITSTVSINSIFSNTTAGTGRKFIEITNTGGQFYAGLESSTGGSFITGGLAYATVLSANNATALQLATNGIARFTIDGSGNTGIGTNSPQANADIQGAGAASINLKNTTGGTDLKNVRLRNLGSTFFIEGINDAYNAITSQFVFDMQNARLGISAASPQSLLQLGFQNTSTEFLRLSVAYPDGNAKGAIRWHDGSSTVAQIDNRYNGTITSLHFGNFYDAAQGGYTTSTVMSIMGNGRVGIGTTSPASLLHLNSSSSPFIRLQTTNGAGKTWAIGTDNAFSNGLNFSEVGVADGRLFLAAGGNVGIGTTSPRERFEVEGNAGNLRLYGRTGVLDNSLSSNLYFNGSTWERDVSGGASVIYMAGGLLTFNTTSATSGFPTERGRITSAGRWLINTTTDNGTDALQVNGDIIGSTLKATTGFNLRSLGVNRGGIYGLATWLGSGTDYSPTIAAESGLGLYFYVDGGTTKGFNVASTGAATFSSTVAGTSFTAGARTILGAAYVADNASNGNNIGFAFTSGGIISSNGSGSYTSQNFGTTSSRWNAINATTLDLSSTIKQGSGSTWQIGTRTGGFTGGGTISVLPIVIDGTTYYINVYSAVN